MPGPGAHLLYALSGGAALSRLAGGGRRFGPHHCAVYAFNAFLGPDLGAFAEWLASFLPSTPAAAAAGDLAMAAIHHPFYYPLLLGLPLACLYAWLSRRMLRAGLLDAPAGVVLSRRQCFLLIAAGSLSHFFLDHLFEENGHSTMYTWILRTGWWKGRAPINPDAVFVVGLLCVCLIGGFVYINRVNHGKSVTEKSNQSFFLILVIATLYCMWCASQIYLRNPPQPAIGNLLILNRRCTNLCNIKMNNCIALVPIDDNKPDDHHRDEAPKQYFISCILSEGNEFQGTGRKEGEKAERHHWIIRRAKGQAWTGTSKKELAFALIN
ncbi:uncharacterized protein LOC125538642 isoform X4 [Triticum urartu]|uniref:uncharacterized protein LOC125538642 isoform X4 n=1 Tax=Triticum urartu TaxID=4572 RepID=UPI002042C65A|nr:uncharacterized protein LOC125538642 isoform X4 [Triticum urartu]